MSSVHFLPTERLTSLIVGVAGRVEMLATEEGDVMKTLKRLVVGLTTVFVAIAGSAQDLRFGTPWISEEELATVRRGNALETSIKNPELLAAATMAFPLSSDTWDVNSYPNWWNDGDTVYGTRNPAVGAVTHADVAFKISRNNLHSGLGAFIDFDFEIDGSPVCFFLITEHHGLGYVYGSCNFPSVTPPVELRFTERNTVVSGGGSISLDEVGASWVTLSTRTTPAYIFYDGFESAGTSNWTQ